MIRVVTISGEHFIAPSRIEIVQQMRDDAWMWGDRKLAYMEAVAGRVLQQRGVEVRTTVDGFIDDLMRLGYIKESKDD